MTPLEVYEAALHRATDGAASPLLAVTHCGQTRRFDVARWCQTVVGGDAGIVSRCLGPTLDVGCGPGRLAAAVSARGIPALGVDVSPAAIRLTHR
ncbi:MAG: methyltransferase domain-containing protein, partial [Micromonosporaceae bacterium]